MIVAGAVELCRRTRGGDQVERVTSPHFFFFFLYISILSLVRLFVFSLYSADCFSFPESFRVLFVLEGLFVDLRQREENVRGAVSARAHSPRCGDTIPLFDLSSRVLVWRPTDLPARYSDDKVRKESSSVSNVVKNALIASVTPCLHSFFHIFFFCIPLASPAFFPLSVLSSCHSFQCSLFC